MKSEVCRGAENKSIGNDLAVLNVRLNFSNLFAKTSQESRKGGVKQNQQKEMKLRMPQSVEDWWICAPRGEELGIHL